ncbi:hypothetical protein L596_005229 [Steinernema carpocapsae]|uniref:Uncharacterized protein n=1 Tax=Steinernema carpocapsae TaxID=34508 RepID=A0A4V6I8F2_STECR|nr:hypothetical protein L596_005229 [Steinernema carpocapsae]
MFRKCNLCFSVAKDNAGPPLRHFFWIYIDIFVLVSLRSRPGQNVVRCCLQEGWLTGWYTEEKTIGLSVGTPVSFPTTTLVELSSSESRLEATWRLLAKRERRLRHCTPDDAWRQSSTAVAEAPCVITVAFDIVALKTDLLFSVIASAPNSASLVLHAFPLSAGRPPPTAFWYEGVSSAIY